MIAAGQSSTKKKTFRSGSQTSKFRSTLNLEVTPPHFGFDLTKAAEMNQYLHTLTFDSIETIKKIGEYIKQCQVTVLLL